MKKIIDFQKIKNLKTNICFDPLYATANGWFDKILEEINIQEFKKEGKDLEEYFLSITKKVARVWANL